MKYGDPVLKLHIHTGQDLDHVFDSFSIVESIGLPYVYIPERIMRSMLENTV